MLRPWITAWRDGSSSRGSAVRRWHCILVSHVGAPRGSLALRPQPVERPDAIAAFRNRSTHNIFRGRINSFALDITWTLNTNSSYEGKQGNSWLSTLSLSFVSTDAAWLSWAQGKASAPPPR